MGCYPQFSALYWQTVPLQIRLDQQAIDCPGLSRNRKENSLSSTEAMPVLSSSRLLVSLLFSQRSHAILQPIILNPSYVIDRESHPQSFMGSDKRVTGCVVTHCRMLIAGHLRRRCPPSLADYVNMLGKVKSLQLLCSLADLVEYPTSTSTST